MDMVLLSAPQANKPFRCSAPARLGGMPPSGTAVFKRSPAGAEQIATLALDPVLDLTGTQLSRCCNSQIPGFGPDLLARFRN
jgi:hypothetical protein